MFRIEYDWSSTTWTVAGDAITNDKLTNMAAGTVKLRKAGTGEGDPEDGTGSDVRTITGQKWVTVYDSTVAGSAVSAITIPLTGGFGLYRIDGEITPNGNDFASIFRVSKDGGSTWLAGSDYLYMGSVDGGGIVTPIAATTTTFGYFCWTMDTAFPTVGGAVEAFFRQGSAVKNGFLQMRSSSYDGANHTAAALSTFLAAAGAVTHIQLLPSVVGGLYGVGTRIVVEGC
ncbi:hypothetical protein ASE63_18480 [Bosea sp. Root381]|uniref:hypothetical protein n=1 Tax=Bosea sp. Root381 TaxID=1736524 RepID=UPI0006FA0764|nr:hypothetical protein [Bosea sp. Root381]KRE13460.1 hypothetical protein ASE63_18480 [Bosea sp. Root381]